MNKLVLLFVFLFIWNIGNCQWIEEGIGWEYPNVYTKIYPCDQNNLWAFGHVFQMNPVERSFAKSSDGGISWNIGTIEISDSLIHHLTCVVNKDTVWLSFSRFNNSLTDRLLLQTKDGGINWQSQAPPWLSDITESINNLTFFSNLNGLAIGDQVPNSTQKSLLIYHTQDAGLSWQKVPLSNFPSNLSNSDHLSSISILDSIAWIVTTNKLILKSNDWGIHWENVPLIINSILYQAFLFNQNMVIMSCPTLSNNQYWLSTNAGSSWTLFNPIGNVYPFLQKVPGTSGTCVSYSCGVGCGASVSFDTCKTWVDFPELIGIPVHSFNFTDINHGWAGGRTSLPQPYNNGIYRYTGTLMSSPEIPRRNESLKIFPNPTSGNFSITSTGFEELNLHMRITNIYGQSVFIDDFILQSTQTEKKYNLSNLPRGAYLITIWNEYISISQKLILLDY